jgi:hypothetical protein
VQFDAIDPRILPDMSAKVSFLTQEVTAEQQRALLAVNPDALTARDGVTSLFVIRDGKVAQIPVVRGVKLGDLVAIAGAVQAGEKVVLKPPADLKPGALVRVAQT